MLMQPSNIHTLAITPDLDHDAAHPGARGLLAIRLYDTGQASGHSTTSLPVGVTVEVIRCEMAEATDILIHILA